MMPDRSSTLQRAVGGEGWARAKPLAPSPLASHRSSSPRRGARPQEETRLEAEARRALQQATRSGPQRASFHHPPKEVRVSADGSLLGSQSLHRVPSHNADELDQEKGRDQLQNATCS